jgi:hypothetical protein
LFREEVAKELETIGALAKTETHLNKVGTWKNQSCNRTTIIRSMVLENGGFSEASNTIRIGWWRYQITPSSF